MGGAAACGSSAQGGRFTSMSSKWRAVSSFRALCGAEPIAGVARGARVSLERCEGPAVSPVSRAAGADLRWHTTRFIDDGALWRSRFGLCVATASYFPGLAAGGAELPAPGGMTPPPGWRRGVGSAVERRIRRVAINLSKCVNFIEWITNNLPKFNGIYNRIANRVLSRSYRALIALLSRSYRALTIPLTCPYRALTVQQPNAFR